MSGTRLDHDSKPQIELEQISAERNRDTWNMAWCVKNTGPHPLRILAVRLPHAQFESEENRFEPAIDLTPGEETRIQTSVWCDEAPGDVTANAFVIFYVVWRGGPWRIFTRIRVAVNPDGTPQTRTELITTQKVGFSGVKS
jgi:hypothetical protein